MHEIPLLYNALNFVFLWLLPIAFVVFVNGKIWKAASRQMRRIQAQTPAESLRDNSNYQDVRNDVTETPGNGYCPDDLREWNNNRIRLKGKMARRNSGGIQSSNSLDVTDEPGNNCSREWTNNSTKLNEKITRTNHDILSTNSQEDVAKDVTEKPGNDNSHSHPREWTNNSTKMNEKITRTNHGAPFPISEDSTSAVTNEQESKKFHLRLSCINKSTRLNRHNLRRIPSVPLTIPQDQRTRNSRLRKEIKTFRAFLIVIGCFFISWTPFFWVLLIGCFTVVHKSTVTVCGFIAYMNSAYNPLIYGIFNRDFRQALFDSIRKRSRVSARVSKQNPTLHPRL